MMSSDFLQYALAKGVGEISLKKAVSFIEQNNLSWKELVSNPELLISLGIKIDVIERINNNRAKAEKLYDELCDKGIEILIENESRYPKYLRKMLGDKCPAMLFAVGNMDILNSVSVGFCGSRKASEKGISIASDCAKQLVEANVTVVSGYASGTDLAAHRAALKNGGNTVFVLAEGILKKIIKADVRDYLDSHNHVFISQFAPNMTWNAGNAMHRNSVIIGLSRAMILVESGRTGGTFAAGEESLRVGCPLFVIDFAQPDVSAEANPYFISAGGMPIRGKNGIPNISKVLDVVKKDARLGSKSIQGNIEEQIRFDS